VKSPFVGEIVHLSSPKCLAAIVVETGTFRDSLNVDGTSADLYVLKSSMPYFMYAVRRDDSKPPADVTWHPVHEPITGEL
jgi:hypothetical protein